MSGALLHNLCIVERSGALLLSYYFGAVRSAEQDAWEAALADASRSTWAQAGSRDVCILCAGRPVVVRAASDLVFMLSGGPHFEELARACAAATATNRPAVPATRPRHRGRHRGTASLGFCTLSHLPRTVSDAMDHAIAVVTATCDGTLTPRRLSDFHGKVVVCLREMFYGGTLVTPDVAVVLRNAKLKAPG